MKKLSALLLCLALALTMTLALASCDSDEPADTKAPATDAPTDAATDAPTAAETDAPTDAPATDAPTDPVDAPTDPVDAPTDTTADGEEVYDPEVYVTIRTADDLMAFNKAVNEDMADFYDKTVIFLDDIDMTGYTWTPLDGTFLDCVTFDGKGHTVSNFTFADHEPEQGTPAEMIGSGFIGINYGTVTFRDITFKDVKVTAYERAVGCFIGLNRADAGYVTFENVHVKDFTAEGWADYNNQDRENEGHPISFRVAGFVGHNMAGYLDFVGCSAEGLTLTGFHNLAAFVGYDAINTVDEFCFEDCTVSDCHFIFSYCLSDSYTVDMPKKFVSVFYNAANWGDNIDYVAEAGNTYTGVVFHDWTDNNKEYYPDDFRSWTREEAAA